MVATLSFLLMLMWVGYALFGRRWRIEPRLGETIEPCSDAVIAVVPARNEAAELPHTLPSLLTQAHPALRIILIDDHSDDGTADVARQLAAAVNASDRLIVLSAPALPSGWTGKVWAQHQGVERAREFGAEWVWFTDADIRHDPDVLQRLLTTAHRRQRDFVSIMARLHCATRWEKLLIPAFTYFFAGLYPFRPIGNDAARQAGAAGGCMLIRQTALERAGGMVTIRAAVIDDVSLAAACKASGARLWLGYDPGVNSTRGYETLQAIWDMVARSAYTQLRCNTLLLAGCVVGLAYVFLLPIAAILWGTDRATLPALIAYAAMVWTYRPIVVFLGVAPGWALALPLAAVLYTGMTVSSAWRHYAGAGAGWKGRFYGTDVTQG
jgi:hopene-associated glycosyltransferase HpnB